MIFLLIYILCSILTTIVTVYASCTYDDNELKMSDTSIVTAVFISLIMGTVWPISWTLVLLYLFGKNVYDITKKQTENKTEDKESEDKKCSD